MCGSGNMLFRYTSQAKDKISGQYAPENKKRRKYASHVFRRFVVLFYTNAFNCSVSSISRSRLTSISAVY